LVVVVVVNTQVVIKVVPMAVLAAVVLKLVVLRDWVPLAKVIMVVVIGMLQVQAEVELALLHRLVQVDQLLLLKHKLAVELDCNHL
jgi:hypothetical protein